MDPKVWGPHAWIFLHSITLNYPSYPTKQVIKQHYDFFTNLFYVIPCDKCRQHYKQNLVKYPLTNKILSSRENLIKWLINIHNSVNEMQGKKQYSYDEVINIYNNLYNNASNGFATSNRYIIVIILIMMIVCLIFSNNIVKLFK